MSTFQLGVFLILDILIPLLVSLPLMFLSALFSGFIANKVNKKTALILTLIEFVLLIMLQFEILSWMSYDGIVVGRIGTYIINGIIFIWACKRAFNWTSNGAHICPHCGVWNSYIILKTKPTKYWESLDTVEKTIRNKDGDVIARYDDREVRTHSSTTYILKCKKCKEEYEHSECRF